MERMIKNGTYEKHKLAMRNRYHNKIKNNFEEMNKRNTYYRDWYFKNKDKVKLQRNKSPAYKRKKIEPIQKPVVKITKSCFILTFD